MASRVVSDPDIMGGAACFRGTRIPVAFVRSLLKAGNTPEWVLRQYEGQLTLADILAAWWWRNGDDGR